MGRPRKQVYDWSKLPLRKRKHENGEPCAVCKGPIGKGMTYIDGGNENRVHPLCVGNVPSERPKQPWSYTTLQSST